jgi:hypothetical protein
MKRNLLLSVILSCYLITVGCAAVITGAVVGAGAYTYMNGQLSRLYQAPFDTTNQACTATLKKLKIAITEEASDGINMTIKAKRTDGTSVTVITEMVEPSITKVSVRSGMVGIWDKNVSELIHASIAQRLQK